MIKARQKLGQYRIERRIARGGFADVYQAFDTIEGIKVVLKVPHANLVDADVLAGFRQEVRLTAKLDHPNILAIKTAGFIGGHFAIVYPLGVEDLGERLTRRVGVRTGIDYIEQLLEAVAYAHERRIVHCDIKPENLILFDEGKLRLTDFGIAKVAIRTLRAAGTGTVGFVAPEQAMGRPSFHSDVFSAGLVAYRLLAGQLPEWPFEWPFPGHARLKERVHVDVLEFIRRAVAVAPKDRFADGVKMRAAFARIRRRALLHAGQRAARRTGLAASDRNNGSRMQRALSRFGTNGRTTGSGKTTKDWQIVRFRQFQREFGRVLETRHECTGCGGPIAETMHACPWCQKQQAVFRGESKMPAACPRCKRGVKLDWRFCAWCYGGLVGPLEAREYSDKRYTAQCARSTCERKDLMPFMRYCPWCNGKVKRQWKFVGATSRCKRCKWSLVKGFWDACPWCSARTETRGSSSESSTS